VQCGPASTREKSTTSNPLSGPAFFMMCLNAR
jgi:hypothetical protein